MKIHQTFRLEKELVDTAKNYAKLESRPLSNVYALAVKEFLLKEILKKKK